MTNQINPVNVYDEARKALAEITAIEGVTDGNWSIIKCLGARFIDALDLDSGMDTPVAIMQGKEGGSNAAHISACDPATMQAIAALVSAQDARIDRKDAQIAAFRDVLEDIDSQTNWEINPSNYTHDQVCQMNSQWCVIGNSARAVLDDAANTAEGAAIRAMGVKADE